MARDFYEEFKDDIDWDFIQSLGEISKEDNKWLYELIKIKAGNLSKPVATESTQNENSLPFFAVFRILLIFFLSLMISTIFIAFAFCFCKKNQNNKKENASA